MEDNNKPQMNFTFNFNDKVGQNIAHVDHLEAHFDKDMNMQVIDVEHQGETAVAEEVEEEMSVDDRIKVALEKVIANGVIVNKYDYAMIQMVLEQKLDISFSNGQSFVNYMNDISIAYLSPTADAINKIVSNAKGVHPNWNWVGVDHNEVRRRNNVATQFLSAYNKQ